MIAKDTIERLSTSILAFGRKYRRIARKSKFLQRKAWQKSIRSHKLKSRCRHAKHGYKGGR